MQSYDSLSQALKELRDRGYTEDFNLAPQCLECPSLKLQLHPEDFTVDEFYRFEGASNPDDNSIVYAISAPNGLKGVLVDGYGIYSVNMNAEMARKLHVRHE
jgi:hypothetical protein